MVTGQFRNFSNNLTNADWYVNFVTQNNTQPFIYLDLVFHSSCIGQTIDMAIVEEDFFGDEFMAGDVFGEDNDVYLINNFEIVQNQNTLVFKAGDTWCDIETSPDCKYYLEITVDGQEIYYGYDDNYSGVYIRALYNQSSGDTDWEYLGIVNATNFPGYSYGTYVSDQDPAVLASQGGAGMGESQGGASGLGESEGGASNTEYVPTTLDCGNTQGVGCIQNPLGPGSNLGTFLENLIAIIVQAGIPLVVLALVYSGFRFVLAQGNPEKLVEARKILLWTVVGTAILLGAWTIATIVSNTITAIIT